MTITGKILKIENTELLGEKKYPKRKFYLDRSRKDQFTDDIYPNVNQITLGGEKNVPLIDTFQIGDVVEITCDVKGNFFTHENEEKFSQDLNCWGITLKKRTEQPNQQQNGSSVYNTN